jgi:hypothetical protein
MNPDGEQQPARQENDTSHEPLRLNLLDRSGARDGCHPCDGKPDRRQSGPEHDQALGPTHFLFAEW